ncbi:MAG: TlpA family protein disulfide reductase [Sphaerochaetaceae bacterium]|jgi:thiol-disulfide isomerase/thioredoxin
MKLSSRKLLLLIVLCLALGSVAMAKGQPERKLAPFWTLDLNGQEVSEAIFSPYKLTMVNIWATFCPVCRQELGDLQYLATKLQPQGVQVVGIIADVNGADQKALMESVALAMHITQGSGVTFTNLLPSEDLYDRILKSVQAVPQTLFVDSAGTIIGDLHVGAKKVEEWEKIIASTLQRLN